MDNIMAESSWAECNTQTRGERIQTGSGRRKQTQAPGDKSQNWELPKPGHPSNLTQNCPMGCKMDVRIQLTCAWFYPERVDTKGYKMKRKYVHIPRNVTILVIVANVRTSMIPPT
ncbi:uncharacterized protein LOC113563953 [Drosophila erecta]|uniref:uncharacterized protein LOC113563953 n=1 Tax=Drosophila erecta TaxID=7220 RepID=UPI000F05D360|nr:uncharacterized protein LOC113563953 [Drosophila erecta]